MNRDYLQDLFKNKKNSYSDLLSWVKSECVAEQWGAGILGAYNLIPFASELIGHKPGKMLKSPSKPAKNRYRYSLDKEDRIICSVAYNEKIPPLDEWIHTDEFFEHGVDHIISYKFGSTGGADVTADLERITYAKLEQNKIVKIFSFSIDNEYVEADYRYQDDRVVEIAEKMWYEILYTRNFELKYEDNEVTIFERIADGSVKQIYPEL